MERFWSKVDRKGMYDCWLWLAAKNGNGYGAFQLKSYTQIAAHRYAWILRKGRPIPKGMVIRHSCNRPLCCNPNHLSIGTMKDNSLDMINSNRSMKGEKNHKSKLCADDVIQIKKFLTEGKTMEEIGKIYNVTKQVIFNIKICKIWKHVQ
tara:strand:- start:31103 stop:31552 length:450 start_codon:yes stop_codon:yes gene_type:complete